MRSLRSSYEQEHRRNFRAAASITASHQLHSKQAAWDLHQRCSPSFRFDAGSLCAYQLVAGLPAAGRVSVLWVKHLIAPRDINLQSLIGSFVEQFHQSPWCSDWSSISLQSMLDWSKSIVLDNAYAGMRRTAVMNLLRMLRLATGAEPELEAWLKTWSSTEQRPVLAAAWWVLQRQHRFHSFVTSCQRSPEELANLLRHHLMIPLDFHVMLVARDLTLVVPELGTTLISSTFVMGGGAKQSYIALTGDDQLCMCWDNCCRLAEHLRSRLSDELLRDIFANQLTAYDVEHLLCEHRRYRSAQHALERGGRAARIRDTGNATARAMVRIGRLHDVAAQLQIDVSRLLTAPSHGDCHTSPEPSQELSASPTGRWGTIVYQVVFPTWVSLDLVALAGRCKSEFLAWLVSNGCINWTLIQKTTTAALSHAVYWRAVCPCNQPQCTLLYRGRGILRGHAMYEPGTFLVVHDGEHKVSEQSSLACSSSGPCVSQEVPTLTADTASILTRRTMLNATGTICHLNAVLQLLFTDRAIAAYLREAKPCGRKRCAGCTLQMLEKQSRQPNSHEAMSTSALFDYLRSQRFPTERQQDAWETLGVLTDSTRCGSTCKLWMGLGDVTQCRFKYTFVRIGICDCPNQLVRDYATTYKVAFENVLPLQIPYREDHCVKPEARQRLQTLVDEQLSGIGYRPDTDDIEDCRCGVCDKVNTCTRRSDAITATTDTVIVALRRFRFDTQLKRARRSSITVELNEVVTILGRQYQVQTIVVHQGSSPSSGHYVCYRRSELMPSQWLLFNDSAPIQKVLELPESALTGCYLVLLKRLPESAAADDSNQDAPLAASGALLSGPSHHLFHGALTDDLSNAAAEIIPSAVAVSSPSLLASPRVLEEIAIRSDADEQSETISPNVMLMHNQRAPHVKGHRPDPSLPEPKLGDKIMVLQKGWLELILSGRKSMEIRSQNLSPCFRYLGFGGYVWGCAHFGSALRISSDQEFGEMRSRHHVMSDHRPYGPYTFGLPITRLTVIGPFPYSRRPGHIGLVIYRSLSRSREHDEVTLEPAQTEAHGNPDRNTPVEHSCVVEDDVSDCTAVITHEIPATTITADRTVVFNTKATPIMFSDPITFTPTDLQPDLIGQDRPAPAALLMSLMSDPAQQHGIDATGLDIVGVPCASADIKLSDHSVDGMQHSPGPQQNRSAQESVPVVVQGMTADTKATDCSSGSGVPAPRLRRLRRQSDTVTAAGAKAADCMMIMRAASQSASTERLRASREDIHPVDLLVISTGVTAEKKSDSGEAEGLTSETKATDSSSASGLIAPRLRCLRHLSDSDTAAGAPDAARMMNTAAASQSATQVCERASREVIQLVNQHATLTEEARELLPASSAIGAASAFIRRSHSPHARLQEKVGPNMVQLPSCEVLPEPAQSAGHDEVAPHLDRKELVEHACGVEACLTDSTTDAKHEIASTGVTADATEAFNLEDTRTLLGETITLISPNQQQNHNDKLASNDHANTDDAVVQDRHECGKGETSVLQQEPTDLDPMVLAPVEDVQWTAVTAHDTPGPLLANTSIASDSVGLPMPAAGAVGIALSAPQQSPAPTRLNVPDNTSEVLSAELNTKRMLHALAADVPSPVLITEDPRMVMPTDCHIQWCRCSSLVWLLQ